ncbi:MAG: substrate-binding periplasmic protein [Candidatus Cyclobacteriaceae bacterium M2_1C_046]
MKKILLFIYALFFTSVLYAQQLTGDSWTSVKQNKKGKIVITYTEAPKFAERVNGEYTGLCFDIMKDFVSYVQNRYGVALDVVYADPKNPKDFDEFLQNVKNGSGGVFGLGDVTITSQRKKEYTFSPPYFSNVAILATHNDVPTLSSLSNISSEFSGKKAVVQNGTTHEERIKQLKKKHFPALEVELTTGFEESNEMVSTNKDYFTYIDFSTYLNVLDNKVPLKRHPAGDKSGEYFGFIMPKNSDWEPVLNEFFSQNGGYVRSLEYRKMMAQHLGSHVLKMMGAMN